MFRSIRLFLAAALVTTTLVTATLAQAPSAQGQQPQPTSGSSNSPWVVSVIHTVDLQKVLERMREQSNARVGVPGSIPPFIYNVATGLVVDNAGHIVTRLAHLNPQDKDQNISVATSEGISLPARLIGVDCATGFAVLQVDSLKIGVPDFAATALTNGMPVKILSADVVEKAARSVKNSPVYISPSIATARGQIGADSMYSRARGALTLHSSGLLSRNDSSIVTTFENQVVGIAQYAGFGRAYLFPIDYIRNTIAKRVIEKAGSVPAGWLGAVGDSLAQLAESERKALGLVSKSGVIVREVAPGSPAASGGLMPNDVIVAVNDFDIVGTADLSAVVLTSPAGRNIKLRTIRNREPKEINVVLGARAYSETTYSIATFDEQAETYTSQRAQLDKRLAELKAEYRNYQKAAPSKERSEVLRELVFEMRQLYDSVRALDQQGVEMATASAPNLEIGNNTEAAGVSFPIGFQARDLTPQLASYFGAANGLLVTQVVKDSPAAAAGIRAGDVITDVADQKLSNGEQLTRLLATGRGTISFKLIRDKQQLSVSINNQ